MSILLEASTCHQSPKIRVSTVCPGAGKEVISTGGFKPAKALVMELPLPRPPSFRVYLGSQPVLRPIRGVHSTEGAGATSDRLGEEHEWGGSRASRSAICSQRTPTGDTRQRVRQRPFERPAVLVSSQPDLVTAGPFSPSGGFAAATGPRKDPSHSSEVAQSSARCWTRLDLLTPPFPPYEREGSAIEGECRDRI